MSSRFPARQRGAIGLMAALTLGMALLFLLMVVDSGRLYLEQRKLQRVADMSALEAAGQLGTCNGSGPSADALAKVGAERNGLDAAGRLVTTCGTLQTGANSLRRFSVDASRNEAIRVVVSRDVATSVAAGVLALAKGNAIPTTITLSATAVAATPRPPLAQLRIRTTLATIDTRKSNLLNALADPLGARVSLDVLGWQGLANTDINLLEYLDQLAIKANVQAGNYDELLNTNVSATQLIEAAVEVMKNGSNKALEVASNLARLTVATSDNKVLTLADILQVSAGTPKAGLDTNLQLLQLVQGVILLSNKQNAAVVNLPVDVLGLVTASIQVKVIEPPRVSAIGNPQTDNISVQTAQIRTMVSVNSPVIKSLAGIINAVADLAAPLVNILNSALSLNLKGLLQALSCVVSCKTVDIEALAHAAKFDISISAVAAKSRISDFRCAPDRQLTAATDSAAATISIGKIDDTGSFLNDGSGTINPIPLIDIGTKMCNLLLGCGPRTPFVGGGIGIKPEPVVLLTHQEDLKFSGDNLLEVGKASPYLAMQPSNIIGSLNNTIETLPIHVYKPQNNDVLGNVISVAEGLLTTVTNILKPMIKNLLSPLVDPLINALLKALGIDLNTTEVSANLSCSSTRAQLVL
ncbi:pilus assembly protein TadG-related protein [Pseudomonas sp. GD03860]|uniref:TadG family pilus assembly protein n=1 Tax=Pseudomonas TaxID=286 RepID=UPI0023633DA8|nr:MULTISPECIES: TadG family pilus assembly protein [Pseudomonas]MDD2060230.1 pilus assembly protein TadG-related protein [Pseudomonas putida]MDH0636350.1 pilus assembly protein TadG-related protein [Pseudomonas sp. GD03860]